MIDKNDKLPAYSKEHASLLNVLSQKKEFTALISLFRLEENNITLRMAQLVPTEGEFDGSVKQKLSIYRGRLEELRILLGIFDRVKKTAKKEEDE